MRFTAILAVALVAAPAVAQQAPQWKIDPEFSVPAPGAFPSLQEPPPEGYYRNVPNAYDLLLRPQVWRGQLPVYSGRCRRPTIQNDEQFLAASPEEPAAHQQEMRDFVACLSGKLPSPNQEPNNK